MSGVYELSEKLPEPGFRPVWDAVACQYRDTSPPGTPWLTYFLIIVNVLLFLPMMIVSWNLLVGGSGALMATFDLLKTLPKTACVANLGCLGELLFALFIHIGFPHLLGNILFLYLVGDNIELTLGRLRFLALYFASGIVGGLVQATISLGIDGPAAPFMIAGASAAISGLIGSYLVLYPGSTMCACFGRGLLYYCVPVRASILLVSWIGLQFVYMLIASSIAVYAHLAGLFTGMALTGVLADPRTVERTRNLVRRGIIRGHPASYYELIVPSLSKICKIVIVAAAIVLAALSGYAYPGLREMDGKYYIIYAEYTYTSTRINYYSVILSFNGITRIWAEINDTGPDQVLGDFPRSIEIYYKDYTGQTTYEAPIYYVKLDHVGEAGLLSLLIVVASIIFSFRALSMPERYEITYIPELAENNTTKR